MINKKTNNCFLSILLIITLLLFIFTDIQSSVSPLIIIYNISIFVLLGFKFFKKRNDFYIRKPSYFQLEILFWIFYFIVFYLPYTSLLVTGHVQESTFVPRQFLEQSNRAITASTIGFIAFCLGRNMPILHNNTYGIKKLNNELKMSQFLQLISFLASLIFGILFLPQAIIMITSSYIGSEFSDLSNTINYFFLQFFLSVLSINTLYVYMHTRKFQMLSICSCLVYTFFVIIILLTGDRSGFIQLLAIPVFIISHYLYKIKLKYIIIGGCFIFVLYNFIETFRMMDEFSIEEYLSLQEERNEKHEDDSSFNNTTTLTRASFYYIDCLNSPHSLGFFLTISALRSIPFGISTFFPNEKYYGTAQILTDVCHSNFSLGSSIIAEAYIEFGIIGIILYLFFIGYLVNYSANKLLTNKNGIMELSMYAVVFSIIIVLPRYSTAIIVRELVWMYLLLISTKFIYKNA